MLENSTEAFKLINLLNTIKRWWEMEALRTGAWYLTSDTRKGKGGKGRDIRGGKGGREGEGRTRILFPSHNCRYATRC